jgi:hypothetical protein
MSESISNIRSVPSTHPIKPVTGSKKDRKPGEQEIDREKPDEPDGDVHHPQEADDQDKPLLDEYV